MKTQAVPGAHQQNVSRGRNFTQRSHVNDVAIANGRRHTRPTCFKTNDTAGGEDLPADCFECLRLQPVLNH